MKISTCILRSRRVPRPSGSRTESPMSTVRRGFAVALMLTAAAWTTGCSSGSRSSSGTGRQPADTAEAGSLSTDPSIARAGAPSIAASEIPSCFVESEPPPPTGTEHTDVFQPPSRQGAAPSPSATPAPRPTPQIGALAAQTPFPLFAINAPQSEFAPALLRVTTTGSGNARQVSLFSLQYRIPAQRGGGVVVLLSSPSQAATPPRSDLDDALDIVRLEARLTATTQAGNPLEDPGKALQSIGCPTHEAVSLTIDGSRRVADLINWPGAPRTRLLRFETGSTEVTLETGLLGRDALLVLAQRLVSLQRSPQTVAVLQSVFGGNFPATVPARSTPTPRPALAPTRKPATPGH